MLVEEAQELTPEAVKKFSDIIEDSGIGSSKIKAVKDIQTEDMAHLSDGAKRSLNFSNSIIVDAGQGIGALINAVPQAEQTFSTSEVNKALSDAGLIAEGRVMKMGTSGAVVEDQRGAEVIEVTIFDTRDKVTSVTSKTKAAWSDEEGQLRVSSFDDDKRVLLENEFLVEERDMKKSNALALQIDHVESNDIDLYQLIAKAAEEAGFENYSVRCTISGPIKAKMAVIKALPEQRIENMEGVREALAVHDMQTNSTFHFTGTRSTQVSRQNERWGEITGNPVYSPNGHYHGSSVDGKVGGHIQGITPQKGAKILMIIEPAKVAQIVKK